MVSSVQDEGSVTPVRVLPLVLAAVFGVELAIMLVLSASRPFSGGAVVTSLVDATILAAVLCPVLWLLVVRPLDILVRERGVLLSRLLQMQEDERARLARDLHDEVGQQQTAVLLALRSVVEAGSLEVARARAEAAREIAAGALESARRLARGLAPTVLKDLGLGPALESLCDDYVRLGGPAIDRDIRIGGRLNPDIEIAVYRIGQEAMSNAVQHSDATRIQVRAVREAGGLRLTIRDNGRGLPGEAVPATGAPGLGLRGMRERAILMNGAFEASSGPGKGTTISAFLPETTHEPYQRPDRG